MSELPLPPEGEAWVRNANAHLRDLHPGQRREVLQSLRAHILDALESGDPINVVLARLGPPASVAEANADRTVDGSARGEQGSRFWDVSRGLQIAAFVG